MSKSKTIGFGDTVEFPIGSRQFALVVDIDPEYTSTPKPSLMIARKEGRKVIEGVVEARHVRKVKRVP